MIKYTPRLNRALITATEAHHKIKQVRKGTEIPYIIHPVGVAMIASEVTDDEDILIACLFHDILEDVTTVDSSIYNEDMMREEFGDEVTGIVLDVTKNEEEPDWHKRSQQYLDHLEHEASDKAVIVSGADKAHNLLSVVEDYKIMGDEVWQKFSTKSKADQVWWYESIRDILQKRSAPKELVQKLDNMLGLFK